MTAKGVKKLGLPFFEYLDTTDKVVYPTGCMYKTPYPDTVLLKEIQDQITDNFYSRLTTETPPQAWLRRWHAFIKRRAEVWNRLLLSESALRADDAIYNYDLTEESTEESSGTGSTSASSTGNVQGTDSTSSVAQSFQSDTPDGSLDDIERYMSLGGKDATSGESTSDSASTSTTESDQDFSGVTKRKLTRKGNIGVMTSAQILGGYRDATKYTCYDTIFGECEHFFIGLYEVDDYGYFYTAH